MGALLKPLTTATRTWMLKYINESSTNILREIIPTYQCNLIHERKSILYNTQFERGLGSFTCFAFQAKSFNPFQYSSPFLSTYMRCRSRFPLQRIDFILSNENFSLLLSENDI